MSERETLRSFVKAAVWLFVVALTAGLAWLACWGFCVEFRARYLVGVFAAGFIVKMWMTPIPKGDRK